MIKQQTIDKVLDSCSIIDVVGKYVTLKKRGSRLFGCCPFHQEKTASFCVYPDSDTFYCFGCGERGNSISFLMKHENMEFPEAVKALAREYHVEVEETLQTAEEITQLREKEAMWIANELLAKEYQKQLLSHKGARDYAYGRWGEEFCKLSGVGYCPRNARLVDAVHISPDVAESLHLKNKAGYDFFSGRITIPIVDRNHRIIGFTARAFDDPDASAKYMNSSDSLIYNKSRSIFGISMAWRMAVRNDTFYLVEGAPDCMRLQSIGIDNTVAPLGKEWTDEQLAILHKAARRLCFLPDADPPKEGEQFGPGIKGVMKAGEAAVRKGFSVSVKQIPVTEEKEDPDSYCTSKEVFEGIREEPFVIWMARLLFHENMKVEERAKVINRIAGLLALLEDNTLVEELMVHLSKIDGMKSLWKKAVDKQRKVLEDENDRLKKEMDNEMYRNFGFGVAKDKYYYSISENGGYYVWSNFVMEPLFHIKDAINPKRLYKLKNTSNKQELIEMKQEDLVSLSKFKQRIEGLGNFLWKATEKELTKLKGYLYDKTETAVQITQLGWQRKGFYAFGNGVFYKGKFQFVDEYGIVRLEDLGNFYLPAHSRIYRDDMKLYQFERKFIHVGDSGISLREFSDQIFKVFGNNGRVGFLFLLATLFRDVVTRSTRSFPILNLFGPKGSGKSELGHTLMSFFIIENIPPNINNSTIAGLNDTIAAVSNALVHIDEYKNNLDVTKSEFLKGLWDGTGRTRMNMDLDKKKETTAVDSGIIMSGQEMATADIALFSRLIFLSFSKCTFSDEEKRNYQQLKRMRVKGMTQLTLEILKYRNVVEADFPSTYQQTLTEVSERLRKDNIEDRILLNWVSVLAVYRCLETYLDTSLYYKDMLQIFIDGIRFQNEQCKQNNELAAFWNMVQYLASEGEILEGGDYRIEYLRMLKTKTVNVNWGETHPVLYIQKSRLFMLYKKNGRAVGDTLLPEGSLKYYLEHSREYLGEKSGIRYKVYHHGILQMKKEGDIDGAGQSRVTPPPPMQRLWSSKTSLKNSSKKQRIYFSVCISALRMMGKPPPPSSLSKSKSPVIVITSPSAGYSFGNSRGFASSKASPCEQQARAS